MKTLPLKVLLIEDDDNDIIAISRTLERSDYDVELHAVSKAEDSFWQLDNETFQVLLLDINLPGINGIDLLERITHVGYDVPVVVITGHGSEQIAVKCMKLGAFDYLVKTTDLSYLTALIGVIEKTIERHRVRKEKHDLEKMKADFVAMIAHDLKTPLTAIIGYAELLQNGDFGQLRPQMIGAVDNIYSSANSLHLMIEDFLTTTRIDSGAITLELASISALSSIQDSVEVVRNLLEQKDIKVKVTSGNKLKNVMADYFQLSRVFINLISNAVKFSGSDTEITINAHNSKEILNYVEISISDQGKGISVDEQRLIFDKYKRAKSNLEEGSGLGLFIVSSIIDLHKGRITVQSELGKGSTFTIMLPAAAKG